MAGRRIFGSVFRRRNHRGGAGAAVRYFPGWYVRIRRGEREVLRYGGADRPTAMDVLKQMQREVERQELLGERPENQTTFEVFAEEYLAHCEQTHTPDTAASRRSVVRGVVVPHFTGKRLQDVTRADVERFLSSGRGWARGTRNRYLSVVSAMYKRAIAVGYVENNPAEKIARAKETRTPLPLMTLEDQDRLVEAVPDEVRLLVLFGMDTGMRLGEILRLVWRDVDAAEGAILVRKTKAHRPRVVRMSSRLREAFLAAPRPATSAPDQRIFAPLVGSGGRFRSVPYRAYQAAAATIGFPGLRFHDLRHVTAINLVRGGLDLPAVQATLGHSSLQSTLRYAEYADESASSRAAAVLDRMRAGPGGVGTATFA